jgi:hypothetical protein
MLTNDRDSRVLADVAALGATPDSRRMTPHDRPKPPVPPMAPIVGPRHTSGTGKPGDPFVLEDETPRPGPPPKADADALLWTSPERIAALRRAEEADREEARKARRARMLATVAGARYPGDHPEGEDR